MRSSLVLAALLCFTTWMSIVHATYGPVAKTCCLQWTTTRIPIDRIVNYTIQSEGACPVRAVQLKTTQGKTLCSDPSSAWAIRAMRKVDEEAKNKALQEQGQNEDVSTSNTTPAPSTVKVTTEGRQTWEETEVEEVQEKEDKASKEQGQNEDVSTSNTTPAPSTVKVTTEGRQTWEETEVEEVQEKEDKASKEQGQNEDVSTSNTTPAPSTEKVTTEGRQTWEETEVEEVQEREDVAEEMSYGPVVKSCCLQWSTTRIPLQRISNYTIQSEGACPVRAVLFATKRGKTLCSDPNSVWAVKAMRKVDEKTKKKALREQGQSGDGSTSDITPAASFTSKKAPKRRCRDGRRRMKGKLRRGKKSQRKCV